MNLNHSSDDWPDMTGPVFFRAFRVSSAFLTKNSQMTSPILGLDTRQAVYDWINGLYRAAAALLAHILCHQSWEHRTRVHRWPGGGPGTVIVIRIVSETQLSGQCSVSSSLHTLLHNWQYWVRSARHTGEELMGKSKLLLFTLLSLSICDDNIWPVSGGGRREM